MNTTPTNTVPSAAEDLLATATPERRKEIEAIARAQSQASETANSDAALSDRLREQGLPDHMIKASVEFSHAEVPGAQK